VRTRLSALGTVSDLDSWLTADAKARNTTNNRIMVIIMGLGGLYTLIGVVNSVAIGASTRRREFAAARVTGFTRGQVVRSALLESWAVTLCGLILGALAAGATFVAVLATTSAVTGTATLALPWTLILSVTGAVVGVTSAASVITSWFATRPAPVGLLGATE
jgi:putative ABC transport system permease protein